MPLSAREQWRYAWRVARTASRNGTSTQNICREPGLPLTVATCRLSARANHTGRTSSTRRAALIMAARDRVHASPQYQRLMRGAIHAVWWRATVVERPGVPEPIARALNGGWPRRTPTG